MSNGMHLYGLRDAKRIAASIRKEMAADPATRRSQDPYARGQRDALKELDQRIDALIADIQRSVSNAA